MKTENNYNNRGIIAMLLVSLLTIALLLTVAPRQTARADYVNGLASSFGGAFTYSYGIQGSSPASKVYNDSIKIPVSAVGDVTELIIYDFNVSGNPAYKFDRYGDTNRDTERAYTATESTTSKPVVFVQISDNTKIMRMHQIGDYYYIGIKDSDNNVLFVPNFHYPDSENYNQISFVDGGILKYQYSKIAGGGGATTQYINSACFAKSSVLDITELEIWSPTSYNSDFGWTYTYYMAVDPLMDFEKITKTILLPTPSETEYEVSGIVFRAVKNGEERFLSVYEIDGDYYILGAKQNGAVTFPILTGRLSAPKPIVYTLPDEPSRVGYDFSGWYYNEALTLPYQDGDTITADTDFYPKWILQNYSIAYELRSGTNGANPASYTIESDTIVLKPASRVGYNFLGWYDNPDFAGAKVTSIESGATGNKRLYAKYEIIMCKVTFFVSEIVYAEFEVEYGSALVNPDGSASAAAEGLESIDFEVLLSSYGVEALSSVTGDLQLNAVVLSGLAKWNAFGLWLINNWIWLLIGAAVLIAAIVTVVVVWRRS